MAIQPVILAGGTGTRLWPLSRELYPKQVIQLIGEHSLLQNTLLRVAGIPDVKPPLLVVGDEHRFMAQNQVQCLGLNNDYCILLEPVARNTAPAIGLAATIIAAHDPRGVMVVLPADRVFRLPDNVSFDAGAGVLFNDLTVLFALRTRGRLGLALLVNQPGGGDN